MNMTETAQRFLQTISEREATRQYDFDKVVCYDDLVSLLPHLHLREGIHLYGFCPAGGHGGRTVLMWSDTLPTPEVINEQMLHWNTLDGITLDTCAEAVLEQWLLDNAFRWLPTFWHEHYNDITLLLSVSDAVPMFKRACYMNNDTTTSLGDLLRGKGVGPYVEENDNGTRTLVLYYWYEWGGLYRIDITFDISETGELRVMSSPHTNVYEFHSDLRY